MADPPLPFPSPSPSKKRPAPSGRQNDPPTISINDSGGLDIASSSGMGKALSDRPISPLPKGKRGGKKIRSSEGEGVGGFAIGDEASSAFSPRSPSSSVRASDRLKKLHEGSASRSAGVIKHPSLADDEEDRLSRNAIPKDLAVDVADSERRERAKLEGKGKRRGSGSTPGEKRSGSRRTGSSSHPLSRGRSLLDEGGSAEGEKANEGDGDDGSEERPSDPDSSRLGIHSSSSEFRGMNTEEIAKIRSQAVVEQERRRSIVMSFRKDRGGTGEIAALNGRAMMATGSSAGEKGRGSDKACERKPDDGSSRDGEQQSSAGQVVEVDDTPVAGSGTQEGKGKGKGKVTTPADPPSSPTPNNRGSKTEQPLFPAGTILKIGHGKSFNYPKRRWIEVVDEADPLEGVKDGERRDEEKSGDGDETAKSTSTSTSTPVDSSNQSSGSGSAVSPPAAVANFGGGRSPLPSSRSQPKLKQVDAPVPHQYHRITGVAGQGRLGVYEAKGITRRQIRRRKPKTDLESSINPPFTAPSTQNVELPSPESQINPASRHLAAADRIDLTEPAGGNAVGVAEASTAAVGVEGPEDEYEWESVWEWVDIDGMSPVAIKLQYMLGPDEDILRKEYVKMRQMWNRFARDGDITLLAEPICHGGVMIKRPEEEKWRAGCYSAIVYPLYISLHAVLFGKLGPVNSERRKELLQKAVLAMDRFNQHYVHLDMKFKNLVVEQYIDPADGSQRERVRIIDGGGAKERGTKVEGESGLTGTYRYMSPSVLAAFVRGWMKSAHFAPESGSDYTEADWLELRGTVKAFQFHKLWEDIDQWSLGVQLIELLAENWLRENFFVHDVMLEMKALLESPHLTYSAVDLKIEEIGLSLDRLAGSKDWKGEIDVAYHELIDHCLQRPSGKGLFGRRYQDRRPGLIERVRNLFDIDLQAEENLNSDVTTTKPHSEVGYKKPPEYLSRNATIAEDPLGFYPEVVDFRNGLAQLKLNNVGEAVGSYDAAITTRFDGERIHHPDNDLFSTYGFAVTLFKYICPLPGCNSPTYQGLTSAGGGVRLSRLLQHVNSMTNHTRGARCAWFLSHRYEGQIPVIAEAKEGVKPEIAD